MGNISVSILTASMSLCAFNHPSTSLHRVVWARKCNAVLSRSVKATCSQSQFITCITIQMNGFNLNASYQNDLIQRVPTTWLQRAQSATHLAFHLSSEALVFALERHSSKQLASWLYLFFSLTFFLNFLRAFLPIPSSIHTTTCLRRLPQISR